MKTVQQPEECNYLISFLLYSMKSTFLCLYCPTKKAFLLLCHKQKMKTNFISTKSLWESAVKWGLCRHHHICLTLGMLASVDLLRFEIFECVAIMHLFKSISNVTIYSRKSVWLTICEPNFKTQSYTTAPHCLILQSDCFKRCCLIFYKSS